MIIDFMTTIDFHGQCEENEEDDELVIGEGFYKQDARKVSSPWR